MAPSRAFLTALLAVALAFAAEAALRRTAPRTLRPRAARPLLLGQKGAAAADANCDGKASSCVDCATVLTCAKLNNVFKPLTTTACPTSAPYCSNGACVASVPATDKCYQAPAVHFTCIGDGYFPSPSDCKKYYFCSEGTPYEYDCSSFSGTNYGHVKAMCVPSSEAACSVVSCSAANVGKYQPWPQDKSVYFVCTDAKAANAYVADCGQDRQINATTGDCELTCQRECRLADPDDADAYHECVKTGANAYAGPAACTCPGKATFDADAARCVTKSSGGNSDDNNPHPRESLYAPSADVPETMYNVPDSVLIGSASSAYQIEGGWNASDKTPNIWDVFLHSRPTYDNGDVACDSYNLWKEDVKLLQAMQMQSYRFSLSWTRLLPKGDQAGGADEVGVKYYSDLIDALIAAKITPIITIHHWDIPQIYQDDGGWFNPLIADRFADFADFAFQSFGDRVKLWVLMNEPNIFCPFAYDSGFWAPGVAQTGSGAYLCVHNQILAHAKAYHVYNDTYRATQKGRVGSSLNLNWAEPDGDSAEAAEAAERARLFQFAWFFDPVTRGDYPQVMRDNVDRNSKAEGLSASRLPAFSAEEKELIKDTLDFVGINNYHSDLVSPGKAKLTDAGTRGKDSNTTSRSRPSWTAGVQPWGLRYILGWTRDRYGLPMLITENGLGGKRDEGTNDPARIGYYSTYMRAVMRAVNEDGCDLIGYTAWSLIDNLEWTSGYSQKFGLAYVDFNDPKRTRTLKKSASLFQEIARTRHVPYYEPVVQS